MTILGIILASLLVLGLAVKQVSYILMHGSVFVWLRQAIKLRMDNGSLFFEKMNELFTCHLCMTSQVAIWLVAIPIFFTHLVYQPFGMILDAGVFTETAISSLGAFLAAMAVAAVAKGLWDFLEYPQRKLEEQVRHNERLAAQERLASSNGKADTNTSALEILPFDDFVGLVVRLERTCRGIGCGYRRRDCRLGAVCDSLEERQREEGGSDSNYERIRLALEDVLPDYFRDRWRHKNGKAALGEFRRITYERLREVIST